MEQLEKNPTDFNEVVIGALDEVFGALESERFLSGDVGGIEQALDCYIEQDRRIKDAAGAAEMPGLQRVCTLIEHNLITLYNEHRPLTDDEFSLLSECPEMLARYALNQSDTKVETLIRHLAASSWPAPLEAVDSDELRRLLTCDPVALTSQSDEYPGLFLVPDRVPREDVEGDAAAMDESDEIAASTSESPDGMQSYVRDELPDPSIAMHQALDALIVTYSADDAFGTNDPSLLAGYAELLQALSFFATESGVATLASAADAFATVLNRRATQEGGVTDVERKLLNLFPMLAMDCIADPDSLDAADAMTALVCDRVWEISAPILPIAPAQEAQQISRETLALLATEFGLMSEMLAEDLEAVVARGVSLDARRNALSNYVDVLARVGATAEWVGLAALNRLFGQLVQLVASLTEGLHAEHHALLAELPDKLAAYLASPTDEDACIALAALLIDPAWPSPVPVETLAMWVMALAHVEMVDDMPQDETQSMTAASDDVSIELPPDTNLELLEGLLQELPIQVASFTSSIERFVGGNGSVADLEQAKRAAHTLKGAANTVGVAGIANLTHHLEDLLIGLSSENKLPDDALSSLLMDAGDCLEAMSEAVLGTGPAPEHARQVLQQVLDYAGRTASNDGAVMQVADADVAMSERQESSAQEPGQMLRVPAPVVDELLRLAGENVISNAQIQERLKQTQKQSKSIQKQDALFQKLIAELENLVDVRGIATARKASVDDGDFDPLEFERYSELHTITSQLIEATTDARQMSGQIDEQLHALGELLEVQRRLQMENQHAVIRTRLVPVSTVVSRLQRSVRQACRLLDKQVDLRIIGEATSIDSNMLHELIDPLMHVLRNAVDHGIESSAVRLASGKSGNGRIELSFAREGNSIVVRCKDDGAGLDYAAIRRSALQKGMIAPDRVTSDDELGRLILMPGFSTRESTTQLSGRGIGMDAVHSRILEMKGALILRSSAGSGLLVELRLPATLLSEHTLMTRIGGKLLAVSSRRIIDIHYITRDQIDVIGDQQVYRVGDAVHKLLKLETLLDLPSNPNEAAQLGFPVLLTGTDSGVTCAILVPELVDGREVVVKKFGRYVPKIQGTIGAVILGDGSVAPVIDLPELLRASTQQRQFSDMSRNLMPTDAHVMPTVVRTALVVDDSLSARRASAQIMRDAGYEVRTAIDGLDAIAMIEQAVPDVILVDMEMPRMNGLELTTHLRGRARTKHVPIIMITSRSTEKHRQQGDTAGVDAYLVKPFSEDTLLQHINRLVVA